MTIRVGTIDDHEIVRDGVAARIAEAAPDITVVASVESVEQFSALGVVADVVLLDLMLATGSALGEIPGLVDLGVRVLLYTTEERPVPLRNAVALGVSGVLLKSDPPATMVEAIRHAVAGEFACSGSTAHALLNSGSVARLSPRQVEILRALDQGMDYRQVAKHVGCSEGAVKTHLQRIREKFRNIGVEPGNSHHLTHLATQQGHLG